MLVSLKESFNYNLSNDNKVGICELENKNLSPFCVSCTLHVFCILYFDAPLSLEDFLNS